MLFWIIISFKSEAITNKIDKYFYIYDMFEDHGTGENDRYKQEIQERKN